MVVAQPGWMLRLLRWCGGSAWLDVEVAAVVVVVVVAQPGWMLRLLRWWWWLSLDVEVAALVVAQSGWMLRLLRWWWLSLAGC